MKKCYFGPLIHVYWDSFINLSLSVQLILIYFLKGYQAADEEGVHPGVLERQEVHVSLLLSCQVLQSPSWKQDVCQSEDDTYRHIKHAKLHKRNKTYSL